MLKAIILLLMAIFLTSCTNSNNDSDTQNSSPFSYNQSDDFILRLFADYEIHQAEDAITIWAEFEYLGEDENITIYHGIPYLVFQIIGDNGFEMIPDQVDVLEYSTLTSGEIYHFDFHKSGGWGADDEDAAFWENFFDEPDLILPPGVYTITANAEFSLSSQNVIESKVTLSTAISIIVQE